MRAYSKWLLLICMSVAACSDDKSDSSEEGVSAEDASTSDSSDTKKSGSAGKSGSGGSGTKASGGSGGKAASSSGDSKSSSGSGDNAKSDDGKKSSDGDSSKSDDAKSDDQKADSSSGDAAESGKTDDKSSNSQSAPTTGDQLSVCSRAEGDCNKGLACHAPASLGSPGRGFCSKICESDDDCAGVSPEGTKYTCGTGNGTNTCEIVCNGTDDTSCPSGLTCVQTARRRAAPVRRDAAGTGGAGGGEGAAGAGGSAAPQGEFRCRYPFEVSKLWGQCGDAAHECDKDLTCQGFWFGGVGHCTKSCDKDEDCAKPDSGNTKPTCRTLVPAFGEDSPAVKQCALSCADAKDDCPNGLACIEQRQPRVEARDGGTEQPQAVAWCL